jgi:hypothetical protein
MAAITLKAYRPDGSLVAELPDFSAVQVNDTLNKEGSWTLGYPLNGRNVSSLLTDEQREVQVFIDGAWIFSGVVEDDGWDESKSDTEVVAIAGRNTAGLLAGGRVYPAGGAGAIPAEHTFTSKTPGEIFRTLFLEYQARGGLPGWTLDFTNTVDTAGATWISSVSITYKAGVTLLDVIKGFSNMGQADWRVDGHVIRMWNPKTVLGQQKNVTFRRGREIAGAPRARTRRNVSTVMLMQGDNNVNTERVDASGVAARGRREGYVSQGGVTDPGTLAAIGDLNLGIYSPNRLSKTQKLVFGPNTTYRPWLDFRPGDYVNTDLSGTTENYRVIAINVSMGTGGFLEGEVVLNDALQEQEILLNEKVSLLMGGATSGTPGSPPAVTPPEDRVAPEKVTGVAAVSTQYQEPTGIKYAQMTISWNPVTQNADVTPLTDFGYYEIQFYYDEDPTLIWGGTATSNAISFSPLRSNKPTHIKVRAVDKNLNVGAWSDLLAADTGTDATPPPIPSAPVVSNGTGFLRVQWDGLGSSGEAMPLDFERVEVWYSTVNNFTPGDVGSVLADYLPAKGATVVSGLVYNTPYFVKLISSDLIGNRSAASAQGTGTPQQVVGTDIGNNVIDFSNIRFKDVGNLVPDGSFEMSTTAAIVQALNKQFAVVTNPSGATAAPSPKVLRVTNAATPYAWVITDQVNAVEAQKFAMIYSFRQSGFAGADTCTLQMKFVNNNGSVTYGQKIFTATGNTSGWVMRQVTYLTVPANTAYVSVEIYANMTTAGALFYLDQFEVRQQMGTMLLEDLAVSTAKIALLAVNDAQIGSMSAGKITVGILNADITLSARIKTADTGARVEISSAGLSAFNASGVQTAKISSTDGSVVLLGSLSSGTSGRRIDINPAATGLPEIRFYPTTGSNYSFINGTTSSDGTKAYLGVNSGLFTANSTTQQFRLYLLDNLATLETIRSSDGFRIGGYTYITPNFATMGNASSLGHDYTFLQLGTDVIVLALDHNVSDGDYNGYVYIDTSHAEIGFGTSGTVQDTAWNLHYSGEIRAIGRYVSNNVANQAFFTGSGFFGSAWGSASFGYGLTLLSTPAVWCQFISSGPTSATSVTAENVNGFTVAVSNGVAGSGVWYWGVRQY